MSVKSKKRRKTEGTKRNDDALDFLPVFFTLVLQTQSWCFTFSHDTFQRPLNLFCMFPRHIVGENFLSKSMCGSVYVGLFTTGLGLETDPGWLAFFTSFFCVKEKSHGLITNSSSSVWSLHLALVKWSIQIQMKLNMGLHFSWQKIKRIMTM